MFNRKSTNAHIIQLGWAQRDCHLASFSARWPCGARAGRRFKRMG
jgi:hypothetical protein